MTRLITPFLNDSCIEKEFGIYILYMKDDQRGVSRFLLKHNGTLGHHYLIFSFADLSWTIFMQSEGRKMKIYGISLFIPSSVGIKKRKKKSNYLHWLSNKNKMRNFLFGRLSREAKNQITMALLQIHTTPHVYLMVKIQIKK